MQHTTDIAIISIPTSGHVHVLAKMAAELKINQPELRIKWILTSWPDFKLNPKVFDLINSCCDELIILYGETRQGLALYARAYELTDSIIQHCINSSYIIYDFLSPEGYIAGKVLNIPAICTNPAIIGPFDPSDENFINDLQEADLPVRQLERKYSVTLKENIQYISGALAIQSDELNLIFSWQRLIDTTCFKQNRKQYNYAFMRSNLKTSTRLDDFAYLQAKKFAGKKIAYFSLGTIATSYKSDDLFNFIIHLYDCLLNDFGCKSEALSEYEIILSLGDKADEISSSRPIPPNFHIYTYLPQEGLLQSGLIDVFITHAGGNGANESIDSNVPMITIPLMHDQHLCAANIAALGIGINYPYIDNDKPYFRESIRPGALKESLDNILHDPTFKQNMEQVKREEPLPFSSLANILMETRHSQLDNIDKVSVS